MRFSTIIIPLYIRTIRWQVTWMPFIHAHFLKEPSTITIILLLLVTSFSSKKLAYTSKSKTQWISPLTHSLYLTMWMQNFHPIGIMRRGFVLKSHCGYGRWNWEVTWRHWSKMIVLEIYMSRYKSSRAGERLARFPAPRLLQALFYCTQALLSSLFHLTKWGKEPSAIAGISWKSYFLKGTYS